MSNGRRGARKSSAACNRPMIIATGALIARDALHPLLGECPVPLTRNPHPQPSPAIVPHSRYCFRDPDLKANYANGQRHLPITSKCLSPVGKHSAEPSHLYSHSRRHALFRAAEALFSSSASTRNVASLLRILTITSRKE
jgi:hypothetical protein